MLKNGKFKKTIMLFAIAQAAFHMILATISWFVLREPLPETMIEGSKWVFIVCTGIYTGSEVTEHCLDRYQERKEKEIEAGKDV